jgi:hypothetical protein
MRRTERKLASTWYVWTYACSSALRMRTPNIPRFLVAASIFEAWEGVKGGLGLSRPASKGYLKSPSQAFCTSVFALSWLMPSPP